MNFLILGAGQTGKLVVEVAHRTADWKCVGFLDPAAELAGTKIHGVEVLGSDELLSTFAKDPQIDGALPVLGNL
ncbi:MAG: hypothetical protein HOB37_03105, partial [Rhodospirillaceae bacterium]|nr:hypothetical protein [Rhodospirillaceae bacterium]